MLLPVTGSPLADTPSARADAFLGRLARFTPADWARAWRRFEQSDLVAYAAARRSLAEALPRLEDDALVARTRLAAVAITDRLPLPDPRSWTPGGARFVTVHAAFAVLCGPLLTAREIDLLAGPFRATDRPRIVARGRPRDGRRSP